MAEIKKKFESLGTYGERILDYPFDYLRLQ